MLGSVRAVRVVTWNVLHRVHAVNWKEAPVGLFPDERVRTAAIARRVASWLGSGASAVCLQEVSGDQLKALRDAVGADAAVLTHRYPRLPRIRGEGGPVLDDATEYLVTIVAGAAGTLPEPLGVTFDSDPGKGLLAVELGNGVCLVDTHVSAGPRRDAQLARLLVATADAARGAVIVGDYNAPAEVVQAALGPSFVLSDVRGQRPTRIGTDEHEGRIIDHVAVRGGRIAEVTVLDPETLSDHAPVSATLHFDGH
jgi:Endonuclease/Exonuclease/phosphatase family